MKRIRTISSLLLALLVLVASTNFTVGMHVCMGEIQNVALFTNADRCPDEQRLPACHQSSDPCCEDEKLTVQSEDLKLSSSSIAVSPLVADDIVHAMVLIAAIVPDAGTVVAPYAHYIPPLRSSDLIIEHRVFLI